MFEREIGQYEQLRKQYDALVASRMSRQSLMEYNEILLSAHSCAIEGNSFTVDDTRIWLWCPSAVRCSNVPR